MLTDEWTNNPLRVAAAAHARRVAYALWDEQAASLGVLTRDRLRGDAMGLFLAGGAAEVRAQAQEYGLSAAEVVEAARGTVAFFSEVRAEGLGIVSKVTGRGDGMGMNVAGGKAKVQAQALEYDLTPAEVTVTARGTAGYFSAMASETTAADLGIVSDNTRRGDGLAMKLGGGAAEVQAQAMEYGLTPADVAEAARGTYAFFVQPKATLASALANRGLGKTNCNKATVVRNPDVLQLGEQIGLEVMGPERWKKYITTSAKQMNPADKPAPGLIAQQWATARSDDERKGWVFHHITMTASRWTMTDQIIYTLPGSTQENPLTHV